MTKEEILDILQQIKDPEIPNLSVIELGMIRDVELSAPNAVIVRFTPTYSGCPATTLIKMEILQRLKEAGVEHIEIVEQLSPPWTTESFSPHALEKLRQAGIAPPHPHHKRGEDPPALGIPCPYCESTDTKLLSAFGTTACKALYQCNSCGQPFDYFKCH